MQRQSRRDIETRLRDLAVWKRGSQRAPHKPLLILLALGRVARGEKRLAAFADIDDELSRLLIEFGPPRKSVHPEYPFWYLQNDGLWELTNPEQLVRRSGKDQPKKSELLRYGTSGGFPKSVYEAFRRSRLFREQVAAMLLQAHFPDSYHEDVLQAVGLPPIRGRSGLVRNTEFPRAVIEAYEYRCAICGYDACLRSTPIGLEAAHIRWFACDGPDSVDNGLALCAIHHRGFDRGAIGVTTDLEVVVSAGVHGGAPTHTWFDGFSGRSLRTPHSHDLRPDPRHLKWHLDQVFRKPSKGRGRST